MSINPLYEQYKDRILTGTALALGALVIGAIDNFFLIWLFLGALFMIALFEANRLFKLHSGAIYYYGLALWVTAAFYPSVEELFFIAAIAYAAVLAYSQKLDQRHFAPLLYPTVGFLFFLTLYNDYGVGSYIWLIVVVASADIGAFVVGKSIGKTPFSKTSPNKTLEGVFGGIAIATILGAIVGIQYSDFFPALIISLFTAVSAVFGDLFESYLKRQADVKDSGNIFPGHGGVLDRLDGYLFGAVVMTLLMRSIN